MEPVYGLYDCKDKVSATDPHLN